MRISLKAARVDAGMTQQQVAQSLGVTKQTVGAWESGKTMPRTDKIEAVCALYGRSYDEIKWNP